MATDYQAQITALYDRLTTLNSNISTRALNSRMVTIENTLRTRQNAIINSLDASETTVNSMQLDLADVITELRSKD